MPEEKPTCPKCGSGLVVSVANQKHCNSCGAEFDLVKNPVAARAQTEKRGLWTQKHTG
jgi:DNA-directed RNA polymerase subunit M/transcription elongation factor TFIIS